MYLLLKITIIFRDSDIQIFLSGDVLLNGNWADLEGTLKEIMIKKGCEDRRHWTLEQTVR